MIICKDFTKLAHSMAKLKYSSLLNSFCYEDTNPDGKIEQTVIYKGMFPKSGLYVMFEKDEKTPDGLDRIVRIGKADNLYKRLTQHFVGDKDKSIFRKHVGRSLLTKQGLSTEQWDTKGFAMPKIEKQVSKYLEENISFLVIEVNDKEERKALESKLIGLVANCQECKPSENWLGRYNKTTKKGKLWNIQDLKNNTPLTDKEECLIKFVDFVHKVFFNQLSANSYGMSLEEFCQKRYKHVK